jgi:rubrerythrin
MKEATDLGINRTGVMRALDRARETLEGTLEDAPAPPAGTDPLGTVRQEYASEADPVGSMPPPVSLKGMVKSVASALRGRGPNVFLDKLGERLAFERSGTRLYQAMISKVEAFGPEPGGPSVADLVEIRDEERSHFEMVAEAIRELGGDPTVQTPSADLAGVAGMGLLQVLTDPRTRVPECLDALLHAELVDNDCWTVLAELAEAMGQAEMAVRFREALEHEERHLEQVRLWVATSLERRALGEEPASETRAVDVEVVEVESAVDSSAAIEDEGEELEAARSSSDSGRARARRSGSKADPPSARRSRAPARTARKRSKG